MKLRGGYNISLAGRPAGRVEVLPEPDVLHLNLKSRRFTFSELSVKDGQRVYPGQILARDSGNYSVPLLAPREGTVGLTDGSDRIVLKDIASAGQEPYHPREGDPHIPHDMGSSGMKRYKLLELGAWEFMHDAHTKQLPDPFGVPQAVIVSAVNLEPFAARGDAQLHKRLSHFTRGLEHLQELLEYQPIFLVLPDIHSQFAEQVRQAIRGYAWVKLVQVPLRYPFGDATLLARSLGIKQDPANPVWSLRTEGVLAIDRALTLSLPCSVRIVSLGGPGVVDPVHLKAMPGYPIEAILKGRIVEEPVRVIDGGVLTGQTEPDLSSGLSSECTGLTVAPEQTEREFLGFVRPGWDRRSYSNCFLSCLRPAFPQADTTGLRGEKRPCVACGFCEDVCPARIMPYLIHKLLYQDELEQIELSGIDLCTTCGLCSYVCPSKIELRAEILEAREKIRQELHPDDDGESPSPATAEVAS